MVLLPVFTDSSGDSNHDVSGLFPHFGRFLSFIELIILFIKLIDRGLSLYALLTNFFISCQLFATLASQLMILWVSVSAIVGRGSRD
jgi:sorbitol-specific phosphotransferase system component IIC